jgi:hypothetical protein
MDRSTRNLVSLKEYIDTRLSAQEKATEVAYVAMNRRLEGMNEFRETLRDQAARLATRTELEASLSTVNSELRQLREFRVALEAKASQQSVNVALAMSLVGLALGIIALFMK